MLLKNSASFLLARGLPAVLNFLAIALYTRLLSPRDYGVYALALALITLGNTLFFEWLHGSLLRFRAKYADRPALFLSNIAAGYALAAALAAAALLAAYLLIDQPQWRRLLPTGALLLIVWGLFETALKLKVADQQPLGFGILNSAKAALALLLGGAFAWHGWGAIGILHGQILAVLVTWLAFSLRDWRPVHPRHLDSALLRRFFHYGLPLTATFAMSMIIGNSDRLLLGWMQGPAASGLYAAGYDVPNSVLGVLLLVIYLAAYPIVVRTLERQGRPAAEARLAEYARLLLAIGLPASIGLMVLAPGVAGLILGEQFRASAERLIPLIALAALLANIKTLYFDLAFQLGQHTRALARILAVAAGTNILLNLLLIPRFGALGAACATLAAQALGLLLSAGEGRRHFRLPLPWRDIGKLLLATAVMAAAIWPLRHHLAPSGLTAAIALGVLVYGAMALLLDVAGVRAYVRTRIGLLRG